MKLNKKAFTVVELVIVIAIIAILAAVLIPTFANMINKANVAKDTQLIRNLNTALASSRASNNNENHKTLYDALQAAEAFGYEVGKINASATNAEILWDQENDVFCYLEGTNIVYLPELVESLERLSLKTRPYHLWKIFDDRNLNNNNEISNNNGFSIYWNGSARTDTVSITGVGFDAGTSSVSEISYSNNDTRNVVIRTNSSNTNLVVYAPEDIVNHYGVAGEVKIKAIKDASYHENGKVAFMEINKGHVVVEETGVVDLMYANPGTFDSANGEFVPDTNVVVKVTNYGDVDHAHIIGIGETVKNNAAVVNAVSSGITFDYNNNVDQNTNSEVYHHVAEADRDGIVAGDTKVTDVDYDPIKDKDAVVQAAKNNEEVEKAKEAGYEVTHHDVLAPTCTEDGHTAYDSYYVNNEEQKIGYKVIPALGQHIADMETGKCSVCGINLFEYIMSTGKPSLNYVNETVFCSTGSDLLPIVAVNPYVNKYSYTDNGVAITSKVHFVFSQIKKETIDDNSYKVVFNLAIKDDDNNDLELKPGNHNTVIPSNGFEYLEVYINILEIPEGYDVSSVTVGDTTLSLTSNSSGNPSLGEYWLGSNHNDIYLNVQTAGLFTITVSKTVQTPEPSPTVIKLYLSKGEVYALAGNFNWNYDDSKTWIFEKDDKQYHCFNIYPEGDYILLECYEISE